MTTQTPQDSMSASTAGSERNNYTGTVADWPLFFIHHNFEAVCFDTQTCRVDYHGFEFGNEQPTPPRAALARERYDAAMTASYGPVPRIAPPARVTWRCKAGVPHEAQIDIATIFKDALIRHNVRREDIAENVSIGTTQVILEVDDRTVRVYTRTMIPLKAPRIAGNQNSNFQDDLIEVYSRTF